MTLRLAINGAVARLCIDRPDKRNAFNQAMWESLPALVAQAMADPGVRVMVLESAHPGVFCAGADIAELLANKDDAQWRAANQAAINRAQTAITDYQGVPALEEALFIMLRSYEALGMTQLRDDTRRVMQASYPQSDYLSKGFKSVDEPWWKIW